jgi:hypothetical protein
MRAFAIALAVAAAASAASAASPAAVRQASINHFNNESIRDWFAPNANGIYLRDRTNRWYYGAFSHACPGVLYDDTIGFDTFGDSRFDRSSRIVTRFGRCGLDSLTRSPAPLAKGGRSNQTSN